MAAIEEQLVQLRGHKEAQSQRIASLEAELQRSQEEADEKESMIESLRSEQESLQAQIDQHHNEIEEIHRGHCYSTRGLEDQVRGLQHQLEMEREAKKVAAAKLQHLMASKVHHIIWNFCL